MKDDQPRPQPSVPVAGNQALTVGPGQTLILTTDRSDTAFVDKLTTFVTERLPGVEVLVIPGVQAMAVYEPGSQTLDVESLVAAGYDPEAVAEHVAREDRA